MLGAVLSVLFCGERKVSGRLHNFPKAHMAYPPPGATAWDQYCMQSEVRPAIQADLLRATAESKIVLLLGAVLLASNCHRTPVGPQP